MTAFDPDKKTCNCGAKSPITSTHCTSCGRELSACFAGTAEILTPDGNRRISEVTTGDYVLAYGAGGRLQPRTIIKKSQHEEMPVFRLFHEHSTVPVRVAADHTFLTNSGWKRAHELKINDEIYFILNGKYTTSKFCYLEGEEGLDTLYNIIVAGDFTFIVDGCVVHSFSYFRRLRTLAYRIVDFSKCRLIPKRTSNDGLGTAAETSDQWA